MSDLIQGEITYLNPEKGYGFIHRDDGQGDCFFHASRLIDVAFEDLAEGDSVQFDTERTDRGVAAFDVRRTVIAGAAR